MDKYELLTWSIGAELPFFEPKEKTLVEFSNKVSAQYPNWVDTLKSFINVIKLSESVDDVELPSQNHMVIYTLVVRVESEYIPMESFQEDWKTFKGKVTEFFRQMISSTVKEFKIISENDK